MTSIKELIGRLKGHIKRLSAEHPKRAQAFLCGLIVLGMGLYTFVISDSNLGKQLRYSHRIQTLTDECKRLEEAYRSDSLKIDSYKQDKASLERIAREEYRMQRPDEVVFIIKDRPVSEDDEDK
ncbi:FtsB family cell division protein [Porphyromonas asaccharolytica]|uniref:FtsB family cell division protein n=1 Tax=Porphyromonas asaccharolytica TaxID=28123 RepID=UPI0001EB2673|nr:septum formation initiator family protein [Porphyromonas asaccharolytica]EFR34635.1 septum formation initiator [Porphyromonas asaccharolytica PR426713P-I]